MIKSSGFDQQRILLTVIFLLTSTVIKYYQHTSSQESHVNDPKMVLEEVSTELLDSGILKATTNGKSVYIQDINAPSNIIWDIITQYDDSIRLRLLNDFIQIRYHTRSTFDEQTKIIRSTLNTSEFHNVKELNGVWHISQHPDSKKQKPGEWSRVCYSVDLIVLSILPSWANNYVSEKLMMQSMYWVKIEAEQRWKDKKGINIFALREKNEQKKVEGSTEITTEHQVTKRELEQRINFELSEFFKSGRTVIVTLGGLIQTVAIAVAWFLAMSFIYVALFYAGLRVIQNIYVLDEHILMNLLVKKFERENTVVI